MNDEVNNNEIISKESKRKINSLLKVGDGITHEFINDEESGYMKDVPSGGKLATIKKLGGRTIVWNQMNDVSKVNTLDGNSKNEFYAPKYNSDNYCTVNNITLKSGTYIYGGILYNPVYANHLYYCKLMYYNPPTLPTGTNLHIRIDRKELGNTLIGGNNLSSVYTRVKENGRSYVYLQVGGTGLNLDVTFTNFHFYISVFDLSLMFGIGNEPTQEEFDQMFHKFRYEYCKPTVIHLGINDIGVRGTQMFDIYSAKKYWTPSNASDPDNYIIEDNKIIIKKSLLYGYSYPYSFSDKYTNVTVTCKIITNTATKPMVRITKNIPTYTQKTTNFYEGEKTTSTISNVNAIFLDYSIAGSGVPIFTIEDLIISKSPTEIPWQPYKKDVYEIPEEIKNLDVYGWGIKDVYNYIDLETKTFHKRINRVDLGTFTWSYYEYMTDKFNFRIKSPSDIAPTKGTDNHNNILCNEYTEMTWGYSYSNYINKSISQLSTEIAIVDTRYTDAKSFKEAMNGVYLYYEMKNEIVTDISDIIPEGFLESLPLDEYGAIIFENNKITDFVPIPNSIEYLCELTKS